MENRDRIISKQELVEHIWSDQFISNAALESTIRLLRKELNDSGREQRVIQTVFGHGYRFVALVTERIAGDPSPPPDTVQTDPPPSPEVGWTCPTCQHINVFGANIHNRFCIECGTQLQRLCPGCQAGNPPQAKFCGACGHSLSDASPLESQRASNPNRLQAEHRQLTCMSCDLVGAATLPGQLELEDLRDVIRT
ncbi:MAG: hypothetical protein ETSY2_48440 [Candidatus Entotheonella gemina]|uniref:OmpR/PhoB-type domain-containing protein n=1 Tax=Candidatus Entotheonella gemina TaxID=1429439 RepID=W4LB59_9BACT|nr:MAG: hypothetical protein ETSY2_48440 [Candidatus Entotheonella gemina]